MKRLILLTTLYVIGYSGNVEKCNDFSGSYSGSSTMGYTSGTAEIIVDSDCSAILTYNQGDMGGATEKGEIIKSGGGYKFKSTSGGGTYSLIISANKIILDGSNWHCDMKKQ